MGMGGAGFPTSVKLKPAKPVDTILVNGCECEPLLTADHRVLLEYPDDIFWPPGYFESGGRGEGPIVIEDNKPDAIADAGEGGGHRKYRRGAVKPSTHRARRKC